MASSTLHTFLVLAFGIYEATAGQWCYTDKSYSSQLRYCIWGCCTVNSRTQCCEKTNVGMLVGSIVGGVIGLLVMVSIIICFCCIMKRNRARQGQIFSATHSPLIYGTPGTQMAYVQQPYQPYPIQINNMAPVSMTAPPQPAQPWQPPSYEDANRDFKP